MKEIPSPIQLEFNTPVTLDSLERIDTTIGDKNFGLCPEPTNTISYLLNGTKGSLTTNIKNILALENIPLLMVLMEVNEFTSDINRGHMGRLTFSLSSIPRPKFIDTDCQNPLTGKEMLGVAVKQFDKIQPGFLSPWTSSPYVRGLHMLAFSELQKSRTGQTVFPQSKFANLADVLIDLYKPDDRTFVIMGHYFENRRTVNASRFSAFSLKDYEGNEENVTL